MGKGSPVGLGRLSHHGVFPAGQTYGLTAQIRRAASSIPSNIAEGCGRNGDAEVARFCLIARGSASELEYQILLAHDLKLLPSGHYEQLTEALGKMAVERLSKVLRTNLLQSPELFGTERGGFCGEQH